MFAKQKYHQRRRKTVEVERRIVWGEETRYLERQKKTGLGGKITITILGGDFDGLKGKIGNVWRLLSALFFCCILKHE